MSETLVQIGGAPSASSPRREGRPEWLRIRLATPASYHQVRSLVERLESPYGLPGGPLPQHL